MEAVQETDEDRQERIQKWRLARALREAPDLLAHVRSIAISGRSERGETLGEWSAPLRITAVDDADAVYALLVSWVIHLAHLIQVSPPSLTVVAWSLRDKDLTAGEKLLGFRAESTPEGVALLIRTQTMWLLIHQEQIEGTETYDDFRRQTLRALWSLRSRYPMQQRRERSTEDRECPACHRWMVRASWFSDDMRDAQVRCHGCGYVMDTPVKMLDALDWDTKEGRDCTCRYEGDPKGAKRCPVHQTDDLRDDLLGREFLLPTELAALLRVEKSTVSRWMNRDENSLEGVRAGGKMLVRAVEGLRYAADEDRRTRP